jgi:hypothetical protein
MSGELTHQANYPQFDLEAIDQRSVEATQQAYTTERQRVAELPEYGNAVENERAQIEKSYPDDGPFEIKVADYLDERAWQVVEIIQEDAPTVADRDYLTRYLGQPEGTTLVELSNAYSRRIKYMFVLAGAINNNMTLAEYRAYEANINEELTGMGDVISAAYRNEHMI